MFRLRYLKSLWLVVLLLPLIAQGQDTITFKGKDDRLDNFYVNRGWRYHAGDNPEWALPSYNDSSWEVWKFSGYSGDRDSMLPAITWWRHPLVVDSSLAGKPMVLTIEMNGAMELYLDGVLLHRYGTIGNKGENVALAEEKEQPFAFVIPAAGRHLLALRYAEVKVRANRIHEQVRHGFALWIGEANSEMARNNNHDTLTGGLAMFLFGLFLAFAILHAILYVYYRAGKSNAWFALFSITLAVLFLWPNKYVASWRGFIQFFDRWGVPLVLLAAFALSGFINSIFTKRRPWLRILVLLFLPLSFVNDTIGINIMVGAIVSASVETIFTIGFAMYQRRPGARIIGAGLLLFMLLLLGLVIFAIARQDLGFGFEGNTGSVMLLLTFVAILCIPVSMSTYLAWSFAGINKNLQKHLSEVERLSAEARANEAEKERLLKGRQEELEQEVAVRTTELRRQKQQSEDLLLNILPSEVADELKLNGHATARQFDHVTVLFTDFVDFTQHSEALAPEALVAEIHECFSAFDDIITRNGMEKIKTVGDAYIAVSGMPAANPNHAKDAIRAALEIRDFMEVRQRSNPSSFGIRIGVHSGPVVAGIVGVKKFAYDIWGDTVNTAARMEQNSEPGRVNISDATHNMVKDAFSCESRGELEVKHKGRMVMWWVEG